MKEKKTKKKFIQVFPTVDIAIIRLYKPDYKPDIDGL